MVLALTGTSAIGPAAPGWPREVMARTGTHLSSMVHLLVSSKFRHKLPLGGTLPFEGRPEPSTPV